MNARPQHILALAAALVLAGCAGAGRVTGGPGRPSAVARQTSEAAAPTATQARIEASVELLANGEPQKAARELNAVLAAEPRNAIARKLLDQVEKDPVVLLGSRSFPYTAKRGDSLSLLAGRFLGDPMLFYALARYNGLSSPAALDAGRVLSIPGTPKAKTAPRPAPARAAAPAQSPVRDPTLAGKLRADALDQLSDGALDRAVVLLRQARALDPQSEAIRRDLDRATRLQAAIDPS